MKWRAIGESIDKLRVIPRVLLGLYTWQAWIVGAWAMSRPDLTTPQTVFVSTVYGVYPMLLNFYMQNGTDWKADAPK
jgi:hypothetical protein